jgi:hypothetical protein
MTVNSIEKLQALAGQLQDAPPAEGTDAILQMTFVSALPMLWPMVPEDPAQLDELLERAAEFVTSLRSDPVELAAVPDPPAA